MTRVDILDGWRALSITLVMAAHLLPLGPHSWEMNYAAGAAGMAIFFTLSGFLITQFMIRDGDIQRFLIRRISRIVPLAWAGMTLAYVLLGGTVEQYVANVSFFANNLPTGMLPGGGHFWSLCLEMQFYLGIALLVALGKKRALLLLPIGCLAVTALRITYGTPLNIVTWFRLDEILAGATLALIHEGWLGARAKAVVARGWVLGLFALLIVSSAPWSGPLAYLRPYFAALAVGASIYNAPAWMHGLARSRPVVYIALTSYALYVFHGVFSHTWLGSGDKMVMYAKRPLLFAATFLAAHLSTFYYESFWTGYAKRITQRKPATVG
jgi:peptidoglycan/LPS O-acetylase OafA/YrhL